MSNCSGQCVVCKLSGYCLADHFDNDFELMEVEKLREMLKTKWQPNWKRELTPEELTFVDSLFYRGRKSQSTKLGTPIVDTLLYKKLREFLSPTSTQKVFEVLNTVCTNCWDNSKGCQCWNDK